MKSDRFGMELRSREKDPEDVIDHIKRLPQQDEKHSVQMSECSETNADRQQPVELPEEREKNDRLPLSGYAM